MEGESPKLVSTPTGAVFLSYASQDAEAAQRICEALRATPEWSFGNERLLTRDGCARRYTEEEKGE
jgi:hypothetical protein